MMHKNQPTKIRENVPLAPLTTFGTGGPARFFLSAETIKDVQEGLIFADRKRLAVFILGGGSNVVVSDNGFPGLVLQIVPKGIRCEADADSIRLSVAAGEVWDDIVAYAVERDWWGIENLTAIPGNCGAVAIQNVGAYGQEAADVIEAVTVLDRKDGDIKTLSAEECQFAYRESIFNRSAKDRYIIWETHFRLSRKGQAHTGYPDVRSYLQERQITHPTPREMRTAISAIRARKFADPATIGTAGSFFKNIYISEAQFLDLAKKVASISPPEVLDKLQRVRERFSSESGIKIPTAFLIDQVCGLKGHRIGGAQVSPTQALAIINPEKRATGTEVQQLIKHVQTVVREKTGLEIELEPALVGFS